MPKRYLGVRARAGYVELFTEEHGDREPLPIIECHRNGQLDWTGGDASDNLAFSIFSDIIREPENEARANTSRTMWAALIFADRMLPWLPADPGGSGRRGTSWCFDEEDLRRWLAADEAVREMKDKIKGIFGWSPETRAQKDQLEQQLPALNRAVELAENELRRKIIQQRPCHVCHGQGAIDECPECQGRGMIYGKDPSGRLVGGNCRSCNGSGKNPRQKGDCPNCWGKGYEPRAGASHAGCLTCIAIAVPVTIGCGLLVNIRALS